MNQGLYLIVACFSFLHLSNALELMKKKEIDGNSSIGINSKKDLQAKLHLRQKRLRTRSRILDRYHGIPKEEVLNKIKSLMMDKNSRRFGKRDILEEKQYLQLDQLKDKPKEGDKDERTKSEQINEDEQYLNSDRIFRQTQDTQSEPKADQWIYDEATKNLIMSLSLIRKKRFIESDPDDEDVIKKEMANENLKRNTFLKDLEEDGYLAGANDSTLDYQDDNTLNLYSKSGKENYPSLEDYKAFVRDNKKKKRNVSLYSNVNSDKSKEDDDEKFYDVDHLLLKNEDALIAEAVDMIQRDNNLKGNLANVKEKVESKLNAAYDLEDIRMALFDLRNFMNKEQVKNKSSNEMTNKNDKMSQMNRKCNSQSKE